MNCPVLTELELTEAYEPEHENPPVLSGGSYDIDAIRSCGENCKVAADNARLREAALAYQELATCYRIGKTPKESLFKRLEIARTTLEGK